MKNTSSAPLGSSLKRILEELRSRLPEEATILISTLAKFFNNAGIPMKKLEDISTDERADIKQERSPSD